MPVRGPGPYQLKALSVRLKEAGTQGQGLRRELYKAVNNAARPVTAQIKSADHLRSFTPSGYTETLAADLTVTAVKRTGRDPGISIRAKGRTHKRKVEDLDAGFIGHPLWGNRSHWYMQTRGVKAGFFGGPVKDAAPAIRDEVLKAMKAVADKITS